MAVAIRETRKEIRLIAKEARSSNDRIVKRIKTLCCDQKELWRRLPLLALQAQYQSGFNQDLMNAYRFGELIPDGLRPWDEKRDLVELEVDLVTGQLINEDDHILSVFKQRINRMKPNDFDTVLEALDAQRCIDRLVTIAGQPFKVKTPDKWNQKKVVRWRRKVIREQGLRPEFTADQRYKGSIDQAEEEELVLWCHEPW